MAVAVVFLLLSIPLAYYAIHQNSRAPLISIQDVSDLRQLNALWEPPCTFISQEEFSIMVNESAGEWDVLNETRILRPLFLLGEDEDLLEIYTSSFAEDVLGYYSLATKEMVIIDRSGAPDAMEKVTLAHEYTHALQDQHFNLSAFRMEVVGWDESLARDALVEGDASLLTYNYIDTLSLNDQIALFNYLDDVESADYNYAVSQLVSFPYSYGAAFAIHVQYIGGWSRLDAAYSEPPTTSEQIMHPEKYLTGEDALEVELDVQVPGMALCVNETLGEFMVLTMLGNYLPAESAEDAAAGWGGDRFQYYEGGDDFLSVWRIAWDSRNDCLEFKTTFSEWIGVLPPEYLAEFTAGRARIVTDGTTATLYRASDADIIDSVLSQSS